MLSPQILSWVLLVVVLPPSCSCEAFSAGGQALSLSGLAHVEARLTGAGTAEAGVRL